MAHWPPIRSPFLARRLLREVGLEDAETEAEADEDADSFVGINQTAQQYQSCHKTLGRVSFYDH